MPLTGFRSSLGLPRWLGTGASVAPCRSFPRQGWWPCLSWLGRTSTYRRDRGVQKNAKAAPSSLPANRSTPWSRFDVLRPPGRPPSQATCLGSRAPRGSALIQCLRPAGRRSEPDSTTNPRRGSGPPSRRSDARRHRTGPVGPGTPFPVPVRLPRPPGGGGASGRCRAQWASCPSEPVRASRSGPAPPALTPVCRRPTRRPLSGSAWLQSSPNTSPGLPQGLDLLGFRAVTLPPRRRFHPVPVPIAVFGVTGILNRRLGTVNRSERNPHESMEFPQWKGLVCTE